MLACGSIVIDDEYVELDDVANGCVRIDDDSPQLEESEMYLRLVVSGNCTIICTSRLARDVYETSTGRCRWSEVGRCGVVKVDACDVLGVVLHHDC